MGDPVFVRIFKQEGQLELWLKKNGRYALYKTFPICKWSGRLGPKLKEADYQSPEGFYSVSAKQLNPHSNYYRAFNVGYPNAFDRQNGRTGGLVMVHGACKSVGCFAMTDRGIEEIYGFVEAALRAGQKEIPVHIFPFRMTDAIIARDRNRRRLARLRQRRRRLYRNGSISGATSSRATIISNRPASRPSPSPAAIIMSSTAGPRPVAGSRAGDVQLAFIR